MPIILGGGDAWRITSFLKENNVPVIVSSVLEAKTDTKYLFIDGRPIPLNTKHTDLNDLFKDRP
jgi:hypothetical protein